MKSLLIHCCLSLIFITAVILKKIETANILAIFPFPGPSQFILVEPYLKSLAARGHQLMVINAFPQKQSTENYRDVAVMEVHANYAEIIGSAASLRNKWDEMTFYADFFINITETVVAHRDVQKLMKTERFDLIILEALHTDAWYALGRHFNAPMIGVSSFGTDPIIDELMGNMSPISYTPLVTAGLTERMSYVERVRNLILTLMELLHVRVHTIPKHREIIRKYLPHIKEDLWELRRNFSLMLLNTHFSLNAARPFVPSMVEVGGFQINYKSATLPENITEFINSSAEDVIYFSMGSNVKSKDFPAAKLQMINEVFRSLPYKVLWKFEDTELPGKPANVHISSWFPQPDILAHPRVKLFISHGGLLSTTEAAYHGVPILGLPVFYDQEMNVKRATELGFALGLDFHSLSRDLLQTTILEMLNNPIYRSNAQTISQLHHDRPMKPLELAIYWTEYVLRHKGALHLQNRAQKMSFIQKYSIDTMGALVTAAILCHIVVITVVWKMAKFIWEKYPMKKQKIN